MKRLFDKLERKQSRAFQLAHRHNPYPKMRGKSHRKFTKWMNAGMKAQDQMTKAIKLHRSNHEATH